jgi:hypothetical protein
VGYVSCFVCESAWPPCCGAFCVEGVWMSEGTACRLHQCGMQLTHLHAAHTLFEPATCPFRLFGWMCAEPNAAMLSGSDCAGCWNTLHVAETALRGSMCCTGATTLSALPMHHHHPRQCIAVLHLRCACCACGWPGLAWGFAGLGIGLVVRDPWWLSVSEFTTVGGRVGTVGEVRSRHPAVRSWVVRKTVA